MEDGEKCQAYLAIAVLKRQHLELPDEGGQYPSCHNHLPIFECFL